MPMAMMPSGSDERDAGIPLSGKDGMSLENYMRTQQTKSWVNKHQVKVKGDTKEMNRKVLQFAKDLFLTWDEDMGGTLDADEIIKPLVALGLASDSSFARKIIQALDQRTTEQKKKKDL